MSQWIPQHLQKRLLKYVLQQLSLFSDIDLPNLDISLGSNSRINLRDLELDSEKINLPGLFVRSGTIDDLTLLLTMSDGVKIDVNGLNLVLAPSTSALTGTETETETDANEEDQYFSLAKSTASLANSVMFADDLDDSEIEGIDNGINSNKDFLFKTEQLLKKQQRTDDNEKGRNENNNDNTTKNSAVSSNDDSSSKFGGMLGRAVEIALSRLRVEVKNTKIILIADPSTIQITIGSISFSSENGIRIVTFANTEVSIIRPVIQRVGSPNSNTDQSRDSNNNNSDSVKNSPKTGKTAASSANSVYTDYVDDSSILTIDATKPNSSLKNMPIPEIITGDIPMNDKKETSELSDTNTDTDSDIDFDDEDNPMMASSYFEKNPLREHLEQNSDNNSTDTTKTDSNDLTESLLISHDMKSSIYMSATSEMFNNSHLNGNKNNHDSNDVDNENNNDERETEEDLSRIGFINQINVKFEGLQKIEDLSIEIDSIKIASDPLPIVVSTILDSLSRLSSKASNNSTNNKSIPSRRQHSSTSSQSGAMAAVTTAALGKTISDGINDNGENDDDSFPLLLESFELNELVIGFDSTIDKYGKFKNENCLKLTMDQFSFAQRSENIAFGSLQSIKIINNLDENIFYFKDLPNKTTNDIRFDVVKNIGEHYRISLIANKQSFLEFNSLDSINALIKFYNVVLTPLLESIQKDRTNITFHNNPSDPNSYRQLMANYRNNRVPRFSSQRNVHPGSKDIQKTEIDASIGQITIKLNLNSMQNDDEINEEDPLTLTITPISYNSLQEVVLIENILLSSLKEKLLSINNILYSKKADSMISKRSHKPIKSYDPNSFQEIIHNTLSKTTVESINISANFDNLMNSIEKINILLENVNFELDPSSILTTDSNIYNLNKFDKIPDSNKNDRDKHNDSYNSRIKPRNSSKYVNSSIVIQSKTLNHYIHISSVEFSLKHLDELFGSIKGQLKNIGVCFFKNGKIQLSILNFTFNRVSNSKSMYPFFGIANTEIKGMPLFLLIMKGSKSINLHFKNVYLNYYGKWLTYLDKRRQRLEKINGRQKPKTVISTSATTNPEAAPISKNKENIKLQISVSDVTIGLIPINLKSKAQLVLQKGNIEMTFFDSHIAIQSSINSIAVLLIDDVNNTLSTEEYKRYKNWVSMNTGHTIFTLTSKLKALGYVNAGSISTLMFNMTINNETYLEQHKVLNKNEYDANGLFNDFAKLDLNNTSQYLPIIDIRIGSDLLNVELCADSTQCLLQLFKDLKQPILFSFNEKYKPTTKEVDIFQDVDNDQFYIKNILQSIKEQVINQNTVSPNVDINDTDSEASSPESINIVDDFLDSDNVNNDITEENGGINKKKKSEDSTEEENLKTGEDKDAKQSEDSEIIFDDSHFNSSIENDYKEKLIPILFELNVSKVIIKLFDGYDWKETQRTIRSAIKRVEEKAEAEIRRRNQLNYDNNNDSNQSFGSPSRQNQDSNDDYQRSNRSRGDVYTRKNNRNNNDNDDNEDEEDDDDDNEEDDDVNYGYAGNRNNELFEEMLYQSIHLSLPVKNNNPNLLSQRINQSINMTGNDNESINSNTPSFRSSSSPVIDEQPQGNNNKSNDHNIDWGKSSPKNLRLKRSKFDKVTVIVQGLDFKMLILDTDEPHIVDVPVVFNPDERIDDSVVANRMFVSVTNVQILDNTPVSTWNMFLGYLREAGDREVGVSMLDLQMDTVRPVPALAATELVINVKVLPLRLYVDQDTLDFLTRFGEFKDDRFIPTLDYPDEELFIQKITVEAVKIKLDYKPKKVDYAGIRSGKTSEFINFFILDESEMTLRKVILYGVPGFPRLNTLLNGLWMPDITSTQLSTVLAGLAPVKSIVKIGSGFRDLVTVPITEYKKDGRVMRSLQKGAFAFAKGAGNELLKFGVKLAAGTQVILETTEEAFGGEGANSRLPENPNSVSNKRKDGSRRRGSRRRSSAGERVKRNRRSSGGGANGGGSGDVGANQKSTNGMQQSIIGRASLNNRDYRRGSVAYDEIYDESYNINNNDEEDDVDDDVNTIYGGDPRVKFKQNVKDGKVFTSTFAHGSRGGSGGNRINSNYGINGDDDDEDEFDNDDYYYYDDDEELEFDDEEYDEINDESQKTVSLYANQPQNLNEGLKTAYNSFGKNIMSARDAMYQATSKAAESGSAQMAAKEIAKAVPIVIIRPIIGTTEAISKALLGGINDLDPEEKLKAEEKYKKIHNNHTATNNNSNSRNNNHHNSSNHHYYNSNNNIV
ncbi:hypothetical protein B5S29_g883 [[Candida] boidinii]|nr:hypothetical protein B5S29_g883 [[Candida] boidinii]